MQDSAADVGPAVTNWRESRPLSSIRLKPDQEGVSGLGNPWPAEAAQAGPEASSGDDLRDDDTEPLPLFAAPAAALRRKHHRRMLRVVRRSPLAANGGITSLMCRPAMQGYRARPLRLGQAVHLLPATQHRVLGIPGPGRDGHLYLCLQAHPRVQRLRPGDRAGGHVIRHLRRAVLVVHPVRRPLRQTPRQADGRRISVGRFRRHLDHGG